MDFDIIDSIDLVDIVDVMLLGISERSTRLRANRVRINPLIVLSDEDFKLKYKFSKRFAMRIVDLLREELSLNTRGNPLSPEIQVICAIGSWARHEIQDDAADLYGVSQPFVSKICKKVAGAIAGISHRFIKMPATFEEQDHTTEKFHKIANFPDVIGAIDCTHIRVKKINTDDGHLYINSKGYPSINVQVVCDADLKIMDIDTRWHGGVDVSRIFRESRVKQRLEAGAFSGILVGDNSYPCTPYLFTPLLNPSTVQEERYNRSHIQTRSPVDRCLRLLKQRFCCLSKGMFCDIETARKTIVACAVLHNIAIEMQEDLFPCEPDDINQDESSKETVMPAVANTELGSIRRRQFIEFNF